MATHCSVLAWRSLVGCCLWGRTESDTTEATQQQQQQSIFNATHSSILAWRTPWTVQTMEVTKSQTRLSDFHFLRVFLASVVVLFISVCLFFFISLVIVLTLLNASCIFSILFSSLQSIFTIIILNSLSGRLLISSWFIQSCGFQPCSFICAVVLCLFICST